MNTTRSLQTERGNGHKRERERVTKKEGESVNTKTIIKSCGGISYIS